MSPDGFPLIDTAADKFRDRDFAGIDVRALGDRRNQFGQLGLRLALAALERCVFGDALAGARVDTGFVF